LLMDKDDRFAIIKFRSGKCHRVTHSAMAAETCAFAEAFDAAFVLKHSLEKLLKRQIRLQMLTDSKQLFDAISHSTQTKEKRILIDIAASSSRLKDTRFRIPASLSQCAFTRSNQQRQKLRRLGLIIGQSSTLKQGRHARVAGVRLRKRRSGARTRVFKSKHVLHADRALPTVAGRGA
jgi:hypothetical protein